MFSVFRLLPKRYYHIWIDYHQSKLDILKIDINIIKMDEEVNNRNHPLRNITITWNPSPAINQTTGKCWEYDTPWQDAFDFYMSGIVLNLVGIVGLLGNILSMIILSRPHMRSSINYLLIGLARSDTILIITSILLFGLRSIYPYTGYMFYYYYFVMPQIVPVLFPLASAAQTASSYLTLMVSLERYVAVCHPLRARALCTYGRSKYYVIFCASVAILFNFIRLWEVQVVEYESPSLGLVYCAVPSKLRQSEEYITIYVHWCYLIVNEFIPFFGLTVFNVLIYLQVRKANRERQRLSRSEKREIGLATMLLFVVIVFFVCNCLALVINIHEAFYGATDDDLIVVSNLLVTLNSSVNFIIYVIFGEKFKRIFLLLFCKRRRREQPDGLMHDDSSLSNGLYGDGNSRNNSKRFSRHGQHNSSRKATNVTTVTSTGTSQKSTRSVQILSSSPATCVYYPSNDMQRALNSYD